MSLADVFGGDAFGLTTLTHSFNKLPFYPTRIGKMGLFEERGIPTRTVIIEEMDGVITILSTKAVGEHGSQLNRPKKRKARNFTVPHIPYDDSIKAADVQDVRLFGSDSQMQSVTQIVNDKLQDMKRAHEITWEYHMMGAITGKVLDSDGSTVIFDLFTEFGTTEQTETTDIGTIDIVVSCQGIRRKIEAALGGGAGDFKVHCFCSSGFFDALIAATDVKALYKEWAAATTMRGDNRRGFLYGDIMFEEYNVTIDSVPFIAANEARAFPVGIPGLFIRRNAPADFMETANTIGQPLYARQEIQKMNRGVDIHTQSNPLHLCVRPRCLIKVVL